MQHFLSGCLRVVDADVSHFGWLFFAGPTTKIPHVNKIKIKALLAFIPS